MLMIILKTHQNPFGENFSLPSKWTMIFLLFVAYKGVIERAIQRFFEKYKELFNCYGSLKKNILIATSCRVYAKGLQLYLGRVPSQVSSQWWVSLLTYSSYFCNLKSSSFWEYLKEERMLLQILHFSTILLW